MHCDDSMEEALDGADAINVLRIQLERAAGGFIPSLSEYSSLFGLNRRRLALAKPGAIVMHPGPMNRGVEISEDLAYDERSWIQEESQKRGSNSYGDAVFDSYGGKRH